MNYLWGGLILISVIFAIGGDLYDQHQGTYENDRTYQLGLVAFDGPLVNRQEVRFSIINEDVEHDATYHVDGSRAQLKIGYAEHLPHQWLQRFGDDREQLISIELNIDDSNRYEARLPVVIWPRLERMMQAGFDMAEFAAKLALGLIGLMALWLGLMKIAEHSGLVNALVRLVRPVLCKLFPEVPDDHPAMGAITLNLSANMLGLGNAATPMGIRAMEYLQELNDHKDRASNSMCMFLALNTSSVQLLPPVTVIALLGVSAGGLFVSIFLATLSSTIVAILAARWYARRQVNI